MRHNFYANNRYSAPVNGSGKGMFNKSSLSGFFDRKIESSRDKSRLYLESLIDHALACFKSDPKIRSEIIEKLSMYQLNVALANYYGDTESAAVLRRNFIRYLDQKINERGR